MDVRDRVRAKGKITEEEKVREPRGRRMLVFCAAGTHDYKVAALKSRKI